MRLIAFLCCLFAFVAQPAAAASSPQLNTLEQQLVSLVRATPGEYGIAALDLGTGQTVSINGDEKFPMASTVKVAVAAAYLSQVDHGRRTLEDMIGKRSAASLMEAMMTRSDNVATDILIRNLGGPKAIQQWLNFHGIAGVRIDRTIAQLLADKRDLWDARDSSTPRAMVAMLNKIDGGNVLTRASRAYLLDLMGRCLTGKNRIRGMLPMGTPVANKTGTLNGLTEDVGFITLPDGRRVIVALFARGGTERARTIAQAARAIYDNLVSAFSNPVTVAYSAP